MKESVTSIIESINAGDKQAAAELLPLVYGELRRMAAAKMAGERAGHTLQPTALVHEAYLRLVDANGNGSEANGWEGRGHFFAAAAEAMRRILIESARKRGSRKRGGDLQRVDFQEAELADRCGDEDLIALDEALERLEAHDPESALVVKLRFFAGMTLHETAAAMGKSPRSIDRLWSYAKAWLHREVVGDQG